MAFSLGQLLIMKQHLDGQEARERTQALANIHAKYSNLHADINRRIVEAANAKQQEEPNAV